MSEKRYSLLEVTEILQISTDTLYSWEDQLPELKPFQQGQRGDRSYSQWEVRLLQQARQLAQYYNQDLTGARRSLESWISKNPRPLSQADYTSATEQEPGETSEELAVSHVFSQSPREHSEPVDDGSSTHVDLEREWIEPHSKHKSLPVDYIEEERNQPVEVIRQSGGRQRRIGKVGGDLFADFADNFDLSPATSSFVAVPNSSRRDSSRSQRYQSSLPPRSQEKSQSPYPSEDRANRQANSDRPPKATRPRAEPKNLTESAEPHAATASRDELYDTAQSLVQDIAHINTQSTSQKSTRDVQKRERRRDTVSPKSTLRSTPHRVNSRISRQDTLHHDATTGDMTSQAEEPHKSTQHATQQMSADWLETSSVTRTSSLAEQFTPQEVTKGSSTRSSVQPVAASTYKSVSTIDAESPLGADEEANVDWSHAYHHNQAQLARVRGELVRSQEVIAKQHHEIKQLQAQLLSMREQVLKEIYDLRDLVLDK